MNLDDKLKMAHEYAKIMLSSELKGDFDFIDFKDIAVDAFTLADEMEKQYNQRKESGLPDALLTKDKDGNCTHFHTTLNRTECFDCGAVLKP